MTLPITIEDLEADFEILINEDVVATGVAGDTVTVREPEVPPPPPDPPTGDVVEFWPLDEDSDGSASVLRIGTQDNTDPINPRRIDLFDPLRATGASGWCKLDYPPAGWQGRYLEAEFINEQGSVRYANFAPSGKWSFEAEIKFDAIASAPKTIMHRGSEYRFQVDSFPPYLKLSSLNAAGTYDAIILSGGVNDCNWLAAGIEYTVRCGWDGAKLWIELEDAANGVRRIESADLGPRVNAVFGTFQISDQSTPLDGYIRNAKFSRAPKSAPAPSPFAPAQLVQQSFESAARVGVDGLYFFKPVYDPIGSRWVWAFSPDHGNPSGIRIGYSASIDVRPDTYALAIPFPTGTFQPGNQVMADLETPNLHYVPSLPRPWLCYAHSYVLSNPPAQNAQETLCFTALTPSQNPADWQCEGIAIPAYQSGGDWNNHTGYANVVAPGELSVVTDWQAFHLAWDATALSKLTRSANPFSFDAHTGEQLDPTSPFPAGYENVNWWMNFVEINGTVYGIGTGFFPGGRGVAACELELLAGTYKPTGRVWELIQNTTPFQAVPTAESELGFTQHVSAVWHGGKLHLFVLFGFFPETGTERVDYYTVELA